MGESTGPRAGARSGSGITLDAPPVHLPDPAELSDQQARGRACVWCALALDNSTAHDLGVRDTDAHGSPVRWFPRSCRRCAVVAAHKALLDHTENCLQCYDNQSHCADGQALRQALKETRR